ncbi:hypothetical protein HPP92_024167 [Vanilla planifolia]|uniref:CHCH domain-containing protein n=1 Tax=Vanilla planifolia TaxID=51239 RepID=A0A835PLY9_VANPL|nr:hypothetical protein HPP92_024167 [Vanilla planifolia]
MGKHKTKSKKLVKDRVISKWSSKNILKPVEPMVVVSLFIGTNISVTRVGGIFHWRFIYFPNYIYVIIIWEMSAGGAFGGNRGARPVPPEKGVFPLDHLHECDLEKQEYIACLKASKFQSEKCRHLSKKYLECRMERNLMAKQDMSTLGFGKESQISFPEASGE